MVGATNIFRNISRLPSEYQEVQYVYNVEGRIGLSYRTWESGCDESLYNSDLEIDLKFMIPSKKHDNSSNAYNSTVCILGGSGRLATSSSVTYIGYNGSSYLYYGIGNYYAEMPGDAIAFTRDSVVSAVWNDSNHRCYQNNTLVCTLEYLPTSGSWELYDQNHGSETDFLQLRYYSLTFKNHSGTVLADFVPCYRKSDNKPGFYELVYGDFTPCVYYYSADGSEPWMCGPNK